MSKRIIKKEAHIIAKMKYDSWLDASYRLYQGQLIFSQDTTSERLHTNVTSLKKTLRKYLTIDSSQLIAADLRNSQPFMSLAFLNPNLSKDIDRIIEGHLSDLKKNHHTEYLKLKTLLSNIRAGLIPSDVTNYIQDVVSGKLYDNMAINWTRATGIKITREMAKERVFKIFFQPPRFMDKLKKEFIRVYPTMWQIISLVNTGFIRVGSGQNSFAKILQNIESFLFLDIACIGLKSGLPNVPLITVHDSIATLPRYVSIVETILGVVLHKALGHSPTINLEDWST